MAFSSQHNRIKIRPFYIGLLLLVLCSFILQAQSIKLFGKKVQSKPKQTPESEALPKVSDLDNQQVIPAKTADASKSQRLKPAQAIQKPIQVKPQATTTSSAPKPDQTPQPKPSSDKSLDSLFDQSAPKKPAQTSSAPSVAPAMTIKAEEHKNDITSVASSSPTTIAAISQSEQKAKESTSLIGGLFGDQKETKPQKTDTLKDDKPKAESQPKHDQKSQPKPQNTDTKLQKSQKQSQNDKATDFSKSKEDKEQNQLTKTKKKDTEKKSEKVSKDDKEQKKQEQSSGDVYYPASKKDSHEEQEKTKGTEKSKNAQGQQQSEQEEKVQQTSKKSTPKPKQPASQQSQSQSQSQQVFNPKQWSKKTSTKSSSPQPNSQQSKQKYSLTLFMTFCLYSLIIVLVVITIKCTSSSTKLVKSVEIMAGALWNMFLVKKGYRKMAVEDHDDQVTEKEQEITVGYNVEDNNKQIFWEKNSVEGI